MFHVSHVIRNDILKLERNGDRKEDKVTEEKNEE